MTGHLDRPAVTPEPPYVVVVFTSVLSESSSASEVAAYERTADRMVELASLQPGFLGVESARDANGLGITLSYWRDRDSVRAWRREAEHAEAQAAGRGKWYAAYRLRVGEIQSETVFGDPAKRGPGDA